MDEIKIWTIEDFQASLVQQTGWVDSEKRLEKILVKNPELLMPGLTLVGRQTQTAGGPLDLLGVDSDGRLVVFELKSGAASRDAVAQIIDYVSDLKNMDLDALVNHISDNSGKHWKTNRPVHFARIGSAENKIVITFCWIAIKLCVDEFNQLFTEIPFEIWPKKLEDLVRNDLHAALQQYDGLEIQFQLTEADWETHKGKLNKLTRAVYDAQQSRL